MQKRFAALLLILTLVPLTVLNAGVQGDRPANPADVSGVWVLSAVVQGEPVAGRLIFKVEGEKLTGTGLGDLLIIGVRREARLEFGLWTQSRSPVAGLLARLKTAGYPALFPLAATPVPGRRNGRPPARPMRHAFTLSSPSSSIA